MPKQLTVHNATITTAAVQVKTLTISGKQVTLAVFRQLRDEDLIAYDATLNGTPWGLVNYHPDKCENSRVAHRHYVWQRGDDLLRTRVDDIPEFDTGGRDLDYLPRDVRMDSPEPLYSAAGDRYLTAKVHAWLRGEIEKPPLEAAMEGYGTRPTSYDRTVRFDFGNGFRCIASASSDVMNATRSKLDAEVEEAKKPSDDRTDWGIRYNQLRAENLAKAKAAYAAAMGKVEASMRTWPTVSPGELQEAFRQEAVAEAERRQRHRDLRKTLADLPQLFIAV